MRWLLGILGLALVIHALARRLGGAEAREPPLAADPGAPPVRLLGDEFDLHSVAPREAAAAVDEFLRDARARGEASVKIIHGKGTGILRRRVRARLAHHPDVLDWHDAVSPGSGRGATVVHLRPTAAPLAPAAPSDLV